MIPAHPPRDERRAALERLYEQSLRDCAAMTERLGRRRNELLARVTP